MDETAATVEEPEEKEVVEEPTLVIWDLTRVDEVALLASLLGNTPELWDDRSLSNPVQAFQSAYLDPNSVVFKIGDNAGMLAVINVVPGFRAQVHVAAWKTEAMRVPELWRRAIRAAMISRDLIYVEGLIVEDNKMSSQAAELTGFEHRGKLRRTSHYNGQPKHLNWYVLERAAVGLED